MGTTSHQSCPNEIASISNLDRTLSFRKAVYSGTAYGMDE